MKRISMILMVIGAISLLIAIGLTVISGIEYQDAESSGLDPGFAPTWIVTGTYSALSVLAMSIVALAILGAVKIFRKQHSNSATHG